MEVIPVVIEFRGFCSKKNRKAPNANGRGLHLEPKTRLIIERMELQVPVDTRDLKLEHPDTEWHFTYTDGAVDRDGVITTVLDILQKYHVIVNDNLAHFNGLMKVFPAIRGEFDSVTVVLYPRVSESVVVDQRPPRYLKPITARIPSVIRQIPEDQGDGLEDIEVGNALWDEY